MPQESFTETFREVPCLQLCGGWYTNNVLQSICERYVTEFVSTELNKALIHGYAPTLPFRKLQSPHIFYALVLYDDCVIAHLGLLLLVSTR